MKEQQMGSSLGMKHCMNGQVKETYDADMRIRKVEKNKMGA